VNPSFADEMLAAPAMVAYLIVKNWQPFAADVAVLIVACVVLAGANWLIVSARKRIRRHLAARRARRVLDALKEAVEGFDDDFPADDPEPAHHMDDTVRIQPYTASLRRRSTGRRPRFPRRPIRRPTSNSNPDRRR
jgi:hypothetical protein